MVIYDVTALRCSEPLRSKVGGASKTSSGCAGWDRLAISGDYLGNSFTKDGYLHLKNDIKITFIFHLL